MSKIQKLVFFCGLSLFCLLYFGFSHKPKKIAGIESNRAASSEILNINNLISGVQNKLSTSDKAFLVALEGEIEQSKDTTSRINLLKKLSGKWYEIEQPAIAGFYAEKVAELENTAESWSIVGTTYSTTFSNNFDKLVKDYALERSVKAFESAISIDPKAIEPKVNLALCYVEYPLQDNPMKGILMLLDLDKKYPDNTLVLTQLGRLAIKTGQIDKAIERLENVMKIEPENRNASCLLVKAYQEKGDQAKIDYYQKKCASNSL